MYYFLWQQCRCIADRCRMQISVARLRHSAYCILQDGCRTQPSSICYSDTTCIRAGICLQSQYWVAILSSKASQASQSNKTGLWLAVASPKTQLHSQSLWLSRLNPEHRAWTGNNTLVLAPVSLKQLRLGNCEAYRNTESSPDLTVLVRLMIRIAIPKATQAWGGSLIVNRNTESSQAYDLPQQVSIATVATRFNFLSLGLGWAQSSTSCELHDIWFNNSCLPAVFVCCVCVWGCVCACARACVC